MELESLQNFTWGLGGFIDMSEDPNNSNQLLSVLRHLMENISYQLNFNASASASLLLSQLNNYSSTGYSTAHDVIYDMGHLVSETLPPLPFPISYIQLHAVLLFLGGWAQYFATFVSSLVGAWALNRATLKNEVLTDILETVISLLITLPAFPALFLAFLGLILVRAGISLVLFLFRRGKLSLLSPVDGFWAYEEHASTSSCLGLYVIEGTCEPEAIRRRMKETVESELVQGKMNRKLTTVLGFSCWETIPLEEMDMRDYVKVVKSDKEVYGEQGVFRMMAEMQDDPIENRAPWEILVFPKFSYGKSSEKEVKHYAVIYRINHAIMDGISTGNVLHSVMADKPFQFSLDPTKPYGERRVKAWQTAALYFLGLLSTPRIGLRNLFLLDNFNNKYYMPGPQLTGPKTFNWTRPIKMSALKEIKNQTHTSVYSVLLSSLGGAFRRFHEKLGPPLDTESFHVMSPIALLPYPDRRPRNRFTGVIVPTSVGEGDLPPVQRLKNNYHCLREMGFTSATFLAIANWYYPCLLGLLPLFLHKPLSLLIHLKMSLSNVPGPAEDVYIYGGGKIVDIGIWLPIKYSMGFGMGLFSYKDKVRATLIADHAYYAKESDVECIKKSFENEIAALGEAVGLKDCFMEDE